MCAKKNEEELISEDATHELTFIAEKLLEYPEILEKSQIPSMKDEENNALVKIIQEYVSLFGKQIHSKMFMKKVNNMKTRLKNKTGNRRMCLLSWEKIMLQAMNADVNPVLNQVPGAVAVSVSPILACASVTEGDVTAPRVQEVLIKIPPQPKMPPKPALADVEPKESAKTKKLTITQLQRLVLIEQLKTARQQQEYFSAKLRRLNETSNQRLTSELTSIEDKTYYNLK